MGDSEAFGEVLARFGRGQTSRADAGKGVSLQALRRIGQ